MLSQYVDQPERRFLSSVLERSDAEVSSPLESFTHDPREAEGAFLDRLGELVDLERPPVLDTDIDHFGYSPEDEGFGRGVLADHLTPTGPTLPLSDELYRRLIIARLQTLTATGLADVQAAATTLFATNWVYENTPRTWASPVRMGAMTARDDGTLLAIARVGGRQRYNISPRTGAQTLLTGDFPAQDADGVTLGNARGMTRRDGEFYITTFPGRFVRVLTWTDDEIVLGSSLQIVDQDGANLTGNLSGVAAFEGQDYIARFAQGNRRELYEFEFDFSPPDDDMGNAVAPFARATKVANLTFGPGSIAEAPDGLYIGTTTGVERLVGLPDDASGDATTEQVSASPEATLIEAMSYYGGRIVYSLSDSTISFALAGDRGFSVFGTDRDPFYLEAVRNNRDKVFLRPAGVPMALYTEEVQDAAR